MSQQQGMHRRETTMADGRTLYYYTFDDAPERVAASQASDAAASQASDAAASDAAEETSPAAAPSSAEERDV